MSAEEARQEEDNDGPAAAAAFSHELIRRSRGFLASQESTNSISRGSLALTEGENWLRLILNGKSNRLLQDTQDTAVSSENVPHPSIVSISDRSYPDNECFVCIDVAGPDIAVKDMRYPDDDYNDLQVFIVRRSESNDTALEELPRRQMRLLKSGDCLVTRHEGSDDDEVDLVLEYHRFTGPPPQSQVETQLSQEEDVPNDTQVESPHGEAMDVDAKSDEEDLLEGDDMEAYEAEEREEEDTQPLETSQPLAKSNISTLTDEGHEFITQAAGGDKEHDDDSSSTTLDTNDFQNAETQFGDTEADEEEARDGDDPEATQAFHMPETLLTQSPRSNDGSQNPPSADGSGQDETGNEDEIHTEHEGDAAMTDADKDTTEANADEALADLPDPVDESEKILFEQSDAKVKHAEAPAENSEVNADKDMAERSSPSSPKVPCTSSTSRQEDFAQESQQSVSLEDAIAAVNSRASQGVVAEDTQIPAPDAEQEDAAAPEEMEKEGDSSSLSEVVNETQPEAKDDMSASSSLTDPHQSQVDSATLKRASEKEPEADQLLETQNKSETHDSIVDSPAATQDDQAQKSSKPALPDDTKMDIEETKMNAEESRVAPRDSESEEHEKSTSDEQEDKVGLDEQKEEGHSGTVEEAEGTKESPVVAKEPENEEPGESKIDDQEDEVVQEEQKEDRTETAPAAREERELAEKPQPSSVVGSTEADAGALESAHNKAEESSTMKGTDEDEALHEEPEDDMEVESSNEVATAAAAPEEEEESNTEVQATPADASPSAASPSENVTPEEGKKRVRTPVSTRASARKRSRQAVAADYSSSKRSKVDSGGSTDIRVLFTGVIVTSQHKKMVKTIGGTLLENTEDAATATHVVAADDEMPLRRTPKLMIGICHTSNIVHLNWLVQSAKERAALPCKDFLLLKDKEFEEKHNFSMRRALRRGDTMRQNNKTLFAGYSIYICKGVAGHKAPPAKELQLIVEGAGGEWLKSLTKVKKEDAKTTLIITSDPPEKKQLNAKDVAKALKAGVRHFTTTWLFDCIISQEITGLSK